jgi:ectoine hydroxylase-related dioxygenase (phytanoyl-CoA dioxygenase family)
MGGTLTAEQRDTFDREGYLVLRGVLDRETVLQPIMDEFEGVLDRLADRLIEHDQISSRHDDLPFIDRFARIVQESGSVHSQYFDCSLPQTRFSPDTPFWTGKAVFNLIRNEAILDVIESLIGPEIYANPVQHVRLKPPEHLVPVDPKTGKIQLGATPWHQDNGVITEDADESEIITVWLPLTDATVQNGCMIVQPGGHRDGLLPHCPNDAPANNRNGGQGLHIPDSYLAPQDAEVSLPMQAGDILLMHRRTPHASHSNKSEHVRWSFDLRYNPIGQATGRGAFPGFVARSAKDPASELHDPVQWTQLWLDARARLSDKTAERFNRWDSESMQCA